ncbi:hypothetical protein Pelo_18091 [Pelomyxa schiedti]|nr:hypothetical protein Pelo_18091 [Pelomyxa schiedti]
MTTHTSEDAWLGPTTCRECSRCVERLPIDQQRKILAPLFERWTCTMTVNCWNCTSTLLSMQFMLNVESYLFFATVIELERLCTRRAAAFRVNAPGPELVAGLLQQIERVNIPFLRAELISSDYNWETYEAYLPRFMKHELYTLALTPIASVKCTDPVLLMDVVNRVPQPDHCPFSFGNAVECFLRSQCIYTSTPLLFNETNIVALHCLKAHINQLLSQLSKDILPFFTPHKAAFEEVMQLCCSHVPGNECGSSQKRITIRKPEEEKITSQKEETAAVGHNNRFHRTRSCWSHWPSIVQKSTVQTPLPLPQNCRKKHIKITSEEQHCPCHHRSSLTALWSDAEGTLCVEKSAHINGQNNTL